MDFAGKTAISTGAASGMGPVLTREAMANMKKLLSRVADPQEIVDLCLFIESEKGQFINGENIMIDGGRNAMGRWR